MNHQKSIRETAAVVVAAVVAVVASMFILRDQKETKDQVFLFAKHFLDFPTISCFVKNDKCVVLITLLPNIQQHFEHFAHLPQLYNIIAKYCNNISSNSLL